MEDKSPKPNVDKNPNTNTFHDRYADETMTPVIPRLEKNEPTLQSNVVKTPAVEGSESAVEEGLSDTGWDMKSDLSEGNVRMKYVSNTTPTND